MQKIISDELRKQGRPGGPGSKVVLFTSLYDQAESVLKALLTLGFADKLSQSFLEYYKVTHLTDTEDSILFILEMLFKMDYPEGRVANICNIVKIVVGEILGNSVHTKTEKFIATVIPAFEVAGAAILEMEIKECKESANQTSAIQIAYFNYNRLNNACKVVSPKLDIQLYLSRSLTERINDLHNGDFIFPPQDTMCLSPKESVTVSTPPPSPGVRNSIARELRGISWLLDKVTNASTFEEQFDVIMDAIVSYVKGEIPIIEVCSKVNEFRKDDRSIIDTWNIYDIMGHLDAGANGFLLGDLLLVKLLERDCREGKGFLKKLAEPIKNWLTRSMFYNLNRIAHDDEEFTCCPISFSEYVSNYRAVWGCDLPFVELGKQMLTIANYLHLRRDTIMFFRKKEHLKDKTKVYQRYLDYSSGYRYNFEAQKFPPHFNEVAVTQAENPRAESKTFYTKINSNTINNLSFVIRSTETIRQLKTMAKFATSIQELMYDGELLIPDDPSFFSMDV